MSIWIIGPSRSGKSRLAENVAHVFGLPIVETGLICRDFCIPGAEYEVLADFAAELLQKDLRYFSWRILKETQGREAVVVGARNPVDFIECFDPTKDGVLLLEAGIIPKPGFDTEGIDSIKAILKFFLSLGIVKQSQVVTMTADRSKEWWYDAAIYSQL